MCFLAVSWHRCGKATISRSNSPQGDELASLARAARDLSQVRASWLTWLGSDWVGWEPFRARNLHDSMAMAPGGFPFEFPTKMVTGGWTILMILMNWRKTGSLTCCWGQLLRLSHGEPRLSRKFLRTSWEKSATNESFKVGQPPRPKEKWLIRTGDPIW